MRLSSLIKLLEVALEENGDMECVTVKNGGAIEPFSMSGVTVQKGYNPQTGNPEVKTLRLQVLL